jgi:hypothetical protein
LDLAPSHNGPDLLIRHNGQKIWIEIICPEPTGIPEESLKTGSGAAITFPHDAMLLRWTAAIKEKSQKLLGDPGKPATGYIQKRIVQPEDAYVIAVNGRMLRGEWFANVNGISQFPFAAEAVFGIGPFQVNIDPSTLKVLNSEHQHRIRIRKPTGAAVPVDSFLDERLCAVSVIWAVDIDDTHVIGNRKKLVVVHNPNANSPIPVGLLPAEYEYLASLINPETYELTRQVGNLVKD